MAYQTGIPTSPVDLVQQLETFLTSNGWTLDKNVAAGAGWETHVHKGGIYAHLRAAVNESVWASNRGNGYALMLYLSDGFDGSQDWNLQPTNPPFANGSSNRVGVGMNLAAGPSSNYYFFTDSTNDNVVVVVEKNPGIFVYLAWGPSVAKNGAWTGGAYFLGSSSGFWAPESPGVGVAGYDVTSLVPGSHGDAVNTIAAFVRCDVDSFVGKWIPIGSQQSSAQGYTGRNGASSLQGGDNPPSSIPAYARAGQSSTYQFSLTSALDGRANLVPILWWAGRDGSTGTTGGFSLIGSPPTIFACNGVGNGFVPASDYSIGPDTYKLFPNFAVLKVV